MMNWLYDPHDENRRVAWLELFYDLVFVATLIELGNLLSGDVSVEGFIKFAALFAAVWWNWTGVTFYANRFIIDDVVHRIIIFVQIFAIATMAISIEGAFGDLRNQFVLAYVGVRLLLVLLYIRSWVYVEETRPLVIGYIIGFAIGASIWLVSLFFDSPITYLLWAIGLGVELATPINAYMSKWQTHYEPHTEHMVERYGIFTIIVLGESFLKTIDNLAGTAVDSNLLFISIFTIITACGLWWLYFDDITESKINKGATALYLWIYFHLPLALGITAFGVAAKKLLEQPFDDPLKTQYRLLMSAAVVFYLVAVTVIDEVTSHPQKSNKSSAMWRAGSAVVIVAVALLGTLLRPLMFTVILALLFVVQIAVDVIQERKSAA